MSSGSPEGIRLYDRIMAHGIEVTAQIPTASKLQVAKQLMASLRHCMIFSIQNVADYFFIHSEKDDWGLTDFPNIAPPYESYFMEFRTTRRHLNRLVNDIPPPYAVGILTYTNDLIKTSSTIGDNPNSNPRWHVTSLTLLQWRKHSPVQPDVLVHAILDKYGRVIEGKQGVKMQAFAFNDILKGKWDNTRDEIYLDAQLTLFPGLLATTFLHCKGMTITEQRPDPGLSKAHQKRHGQPLIRFHTLDIRPMQEVLRREGNIEKTGLKRALHIVRGHFADYTEGRGLFGRHHGIFWMPQHIRGSLDQGLVAKDYDVHNPPATPSV